MIAEEIMQVSEIASDKGKPFVVHDVLFRIFVLIEAEKTDTFKQRSSIEQIKCRIWRSSRKYGNSLFYACASE
jgi:hypothetical protein